MTRSRLVKKGGASLANTEHIKAKTKTNENCFRQLKAKKPGRFPGLQLNFSGSFFGKEHLIAL